MQPKLTPEDIPLPAVWEPDTPTTPAGPGVTGLSWQELLEHWRQDCRKRSINPTLLRFP